MPLSLYDAMVLYNTVLWGQSSLTHLNVCTSSVRSRDISPTINLTSLNKSGKLNKRWRQSNYCNECSGLEMWHQLNKPKMERLFCVRQLYSTLLLSTQVYNGIIRPIERNLLQNASRNLHMSSIPSGVGGRGQGGRGGRGGGQLWGTQCCFTVQKDFR